MRVGRTELLLGAALICLTPAIQAAENTDAIESVTVTGTSDGLSLKGEIPQMETPQNISVISGDFVDSQNLTELRDVLRNVSGVSAGGYYQAFDFFQIRGMDSTGYIYLDGMRYDSSAQVNAELFGLKEIDVLKGPSSALYGEGTAGGLVNLVSKTPERENFLNAEGAYGSYQSYEGNFDGNYVINAKSAVRLLGTWRHSGTFTDYAAGADRIYLAPSYTWDITSDTSLTLLASYQHDRMTITMPLTAEGTIYASEYGKYSLSTYTGVPGHSNQIKDNRTMVGYQFRHRFNDVFSFHSHLRFSTADEKWYKVMYTAYLSDDGSTLYRYPYSADGYHTNFSTDNSVTANFSTGPLTHQLMIGTDYYGYQEHWHFLQVDYTSYMALNLYDPVYDAEMLELTESSHALYRTHDLGAYVQDHITYGNLTFTGSLRWDGDKAYNSGTKTYDAAYTPRLGLTYSVIPGISVYGSYSSSFLPQSGTTYEGVALKPETGQQWEAGVKSSLLHNTLTLTASLFTISRNDVATSDPDHTNYYLVTGKQRSQGFEFSAQGQITDNWQALLNYSYTAAKVVRDTSYPKGDQLSNVPMNMIGGWTRYSFDGMLKGLAVSAGVYHYSSMAGDLPNTFRLPAYTLVNGQLSYRYGPAELDLSIRNLTDETYYSGSYNDTYVQPGTPRTYMLTLKLAL